MEMEMRVIAIAKHIVKPSSPTPDRFKHHKLSRLDQLSPSIYIPLIFFYQNDQPQISISRRLKQSLSEILTVFYPLAGTIKENSFVDCDDTGAEFVEARVHGRRLAPIIQNPNIEELTQLVPADSSSHNDNILLSVKISYFDCGGIAVGACLSHKIGDVASMVIFMNAWAASCRELDSCRMISLSTHPCFDLAIRFPATEKRSPSYPITKGKTAKRLVFERKTIEKLRQEASAASSVKDPTRVEAVSGFIWRNFIEAHKLKPESSPVWTAGHAVNIRPRTVPPMPDHTLGNCFAPAMAVISSEEDGTGPIIVSKLRAAIRAVDNDYICKFIKDIDQNVTEGLLSAEKVAFSSWIRFPVYDVDFGWGRPIWVATTPIAFMNSTILMSTPSGDGIEAWLNFNLDEDDDFFQLLQANFNDLALAI